MKMTDNQKIALAALAALIAFLAVFFKVEADAFREHAKQTKQERKLEYECIRSGECQQ